MWSDHVPQGFTPQRLEILVPHALTWPYCLAAHAGKAAAPCFVSNSAGDRVMNYLLMTYLGTELGFILCL